MKKRIVCLALVLLVHAARAAVIDAPHSAIPCATCHSYSTWWQYSPAGNHVSPEHAALVNTVCLECHDSGATLAVTSHASAVIGSANNYHNGWEVGCTECHDPHFQAQVNWGDEVYLIEGAIDRTQPGSGLTLAKVTIDGKEYDQTTIALVSPLSKESADWPAATWAKKNATTPDRGLILVLDTARRANTYSVIAATPGAIVVKGVVDAKAIVPGVDPDGPGGPLPGNPATADTFGLIYGQLIKQSLTVPFSDPGQSRSVKFFTPNGGFVDTVNSPATGLCQVCHTLTTNPATLTARFRNDGLLPAMADSHAAYLEDLRPGGASTCTVCHSHGAGFKGSGHLPTDFGWATISYTQADGGIEVVDCAACHDAGSDIVAGVHNSRCGLCHINSTGGGALRVAGATGEAAVDPTHGSDGDPSNQTTSATCADCHDRARRPNIQHSLPLIHHDTPGAYAAAGLCTTCHKSAAMAATPFTRAADHSASIVTALTAGSYPDMVNGCGECHRFDPATDIDYTSSGTGIGAMIDPGFDNPRVHDGCTSCHGPAGGLKASGQLNKPSRMVIGYAPGHGAGHTPNLDEGPTTCVSCHGLDPGIIHLNVNHGATVGNSPQCNWCHYQQVGMSNGASVDPNDNLIHDACASCHTISKGIAGDYAIGLVNPADLSRNLVSQMVTPESKGAAVNCTDCHSLHLFNDHRQANHTLVVAASSEGCTACHAATAGLPGPTYGLPTSLTDPTVHEACTSCHNATTGELRSVAEVNLPYVVAMPNGPLVTGHNEPNDGGGECSACHGLNYFANHRHSHAVAQQAADLAQVAPGTACAACHDTAGQGLGTWGAILTEHRSDCATCHSATRLTANPDHPTETVAEVIAAKVNPTACLACHWDKKSPATHGHAATDFTGSEPCRPCHPGPAVVADVHGNRCALCHVNPAAGDYGRRTGVDGDATLADSKLAPCTVCHEPTTFPSGRLHHPPASGGHAVQHLGTPGSTCAQCHDLTAMPLMVDGEPLATTTVCATCHQNGAGGEASNPDCKTGWGVPDFSVGCGGCHGFPPSYPVSPGQANSHGNHPLGCGSCHAATSSDGATITGPESHLNGVRDVVAANGVSFSYTAEPTGGSCAAISCHAATDALWGVANCLGCHAVVQGQRAAIGPQFAANSHHIQGAAVTNQHCYQCHWEATADGFIDPAYHGGSANPGSVVDLVVYGAGARPTAYALDTTAIRYTASGSRAEIGKLNSHCLGCHREANNAAEPFTDGKTPKHYAWDGLSVDARYSQTGTTPWGKHQGAGVTPKHQRTKAFSAHGNAVANEGGWDLAEGWPNKRNGAANVACYDCHNSHGANLDGPTTSYASATANGGLLKDTTLGSGGYAVSYKPVAGGSAADKDLRTAGATLCFDCHLSADGATATPWGYQTTFGEGQAIIGYFDSEFLAPGQTGSQLRYPYKGLTKNAGGHFGASTPLHTTPMHQVNGLCTPCHDPHGVSPSAVGTCSNPAAVSKAACLAGGGVWTPTPQYGVPMLKGTWVTSPYREDAAPAANALGTVRDASYPLGHDATPREGVPYHVDQNTFGPNLRASVTGVTESAAQFAGLCLNCHSKDSLTDGANGGAWKSVDRIHESVKGWGANQRHTYTCSKCHTPHNGSALPRLMVTNCLNSSHKGRSGHTTAPVLSGSGSCDDGNCYGEAQTLGFGWWEELEAFASGGGNFPGSWSGYYPGSYTVSCHENKAADQSWNTVTAWSSEAPSITSGPSAVTGSQLVLLHMDEESWNGSANEVTDSSGANHHGTAYHATTVAGGISGRAGSLNGSDATVRVDYAPPVDNFTIEAWIKPTLPHEIDAESQGGVGGVGGQRYLFWPEQMGGEGGAGISAGSNGVTVYEHGNNYMPALAVYSGAISSSQWTHLAVVYANKRPSIYLNGLLVRTGLPSTMAHVHAPTLIGGGAYGYFPGTLDEVALYNQALSATEIQRHSQANSAVVCNTAEAMIVWSTDFETTSAVDYGETTAYGATAEDGALVKSHGITLSGLTAPATYHYRVRSVNGDGEAISGDYTFIKSACPEVPPLLSAPTATAITSTAATLGAQVTANGSAAITARGTVWGTTANPTANAAAEGGTTTGVFSQARTGLTAGSKIYYRGFASNSVGTGYSSDGSFYTEPATQASGVSFSAVGATGMTVHWTRGSGEGVLVLIKEGTAVDATPVSGTFTGYVANSALASGTQLGSGNYVVHKGPGASVAVSGLKAATSYAVAVYEYQGTVDTAGVDQGTRYRPAPALGSQATTSQATGSTATFPVSQMANCYAGQMVLGGSTIWAGPYLDQDDECDVDRTLLLFDTSSLGSGVTVTSARLSLDYRNRDYLSQDAVTEVHASAWDGSANLSYCGNVGSTLSDNTVTVDQPFGQTSFVISPTSINQTGSTRFAVKGADETPCDNLDPGYDRATSYLEVQYTTN